LLWRRPLLFLSTRENHALVKFFSVRLFAFGTNSRVVHSIFQNNHSPLKINPMECHVVRCSMYTYICTMAARVCPVKKYAVTYDLVNCIRRGRDEENELKCESY
jgi:hypothetical protein